MNKYLYNIGVQMVVISVLFIGCSKDSNYSEAEKPNINNVTNKTVTLNGISFTMVGIKGGTFHMGAQKNNNLGLNYDEEAYNNEFPTHQVTVSNYYIGETEVTQALWKAVMENNPSHFTGDLQRPVEFVSWNDAQIFINILNKLTGVQFRLPTEAEWEYAARGGSLNKGHKYSGSNNIENVGWYWGNANTNTHPVKTKIANELGIYDMSGNVYEWCSDWYGSYNGGSQINPTGAISGTDRVLRGGTWFSDAQYCRVSHRNYNHPGIGGNNYGLRLALSY